MITPTPEQPKKRKHTASEAAIQQSCVAWLWNAHPETRSLFFAIPNEQSLSQALSLAMQKALGSRRRMMGVVSGVADTILLMPRGCYHGLCIEFKSAVGKQSPHQVEWEQRVQQQGYRYKIVRSLEDFKDLIEKYLAL